MTRTLLSGLLTKAPLLSAMNEAAATGFVWQENIHKIVVTILLSMVPTYEGRYAMPVALGMGMPKGFAYLLVVLVSSIPIPFIMLLLRPLLDWFYTLPIKPVQKFAAWLERHTGKKHAAMQEKNQKRTGRFSAEMAELIGLYLFVAIPLPGTGVWTGAAMATLFEMPRLKSAVAILLGNVTACLITLLIATGAFAIF